jgi:hypothetical protein
MLGRIFLGFLSWGLQKNKKIGNDGEWVTMIDGIQETTGKSIGISRQESEGVTGPSLEVSQKILIVSGAECAG